jgi:RHS repeat-associated protein
MLVLQLKNRTSGNFAGHRSRVGRSRVANAEGTRVKRLRLRIGAPSCKDGRFLSVDPSIANTTGSQALNPYSYVGNNPLSGTDPTGYQACVGSNIDRGANTDCRMQGVQTTQLGSPSVSDAKAWNDALHLGPPPASSSGSDVTGPAVQGGTQTSGTDSRTSQQNSNGTPAKDAPSTTTGTLSWKGYVDLGVMGTYYDGRPAQPLVKVGENMFGENLDRTTSFSVIGSIFGNVFGSEVLGPALGKVAAWWAGDTAGDAASSATQLHSVTTVVPLTSSLIAGSLPEVRVPISWLMRLIVRIQPALSFQPARQQTSLVPLPRTSTS